MSAGMPRISLTAASSWRAAVTHVVPRPLARSARQKLHAAWITESNRPGRPLPSWRPMIVGMTIAGHLGEVLGEVRGRGHHPALRTVPRPCRGGRHERQRGRPVELAEAVLDGLVAHDDPAPAAEVAARRRLLGEVDAVEQQLVVDRAFEVEAAAHGPWSSPARDRRRRHRCPSAGTVPRQGSMMQRWDRCCARRLRHRRSWHDGAMADLARACAAAPGAPPHRHHAGAADGLGRVVGPDRRRRRASPPSPSAATRSPTPAVRATTRR